MIKAKMIKCTGEAHTNPYIDNCMVCEPFWGLIPICPDCEDKLLPKGNCQTCEKVFEIDEYK